MQVEYTGSGSLDQRRGRETACRDRSRDINEARLEDAATGWLEGLVRNSYKKK